MANRRKIARVRRARRTHDISRDGLSVDTRNSLDSIATLFQVSIEATAELRRRRCQSELKRRTSPVLQARVRWRGVTTDEMTSHEESH